MNKGRLVASSLCIIIAILILVTSFQDIDKGLEKKEVDCYDKFGSKIVGLRCEKLEDTDLSADIYFLYGALMLLGGVIGFISGLSSKEPRRKHEIKS